MQTTYIRSFIILSMTISLLIQAPAMATESVSPREFSRLVTLTETILLTDGVTSALHTIWFDWYRSDAVSHLSFKEFKQADKTIYVSSWAFLIVTPMNDTFQLELVMPFATKAVAVQGIFDAESRALRRVIEKRYLYEQGDVIEPLQMVKRVLKAQAKVVKTIDGTDV